MKIFLKENLISLSEIKPFPDNKPYPHLYNGSKFHQYHCVLSHDTENCYHLLHIVQDHIDSGAIKVGDRKHKLTSLLTRQIVSCKFT